MYAKTQNQRNGRGQVVASELVRAVLRAENKLTAIRHNEAMYARLSEDFGGYLVTDVEPMSEAEMLATDGGRHCAPGFGAFSENREKYQRLACFTVTGPAVAWEGMRREFLLWVDGEDCRLDAPVWLPGGGARRFEYGIDGFFVGAVLSARGVA